MKKIIGLLLISVLFNACDDGDIQVETLDISDAVTTKCDSKKYYIPNKRQQSNVFKRCKF